MNQRWSDNNPTNPGTVLDQATSHRLVVTAKEHAVRVLNGLMTNAFEQLDDALFKEAEKATNNALQNRFFHAIRELRQLRGLISSSFLRELQKDLESFFAGQPAVESMQTDYLESAEPDPLALLNNAELEEDLAVLTVIAKGEKHHQNTLEQLTGLWASFTSCPTLTHAENPLGPGALTNQFRVALEIWPGEQTVKPIIYDVFYEHVVAHVGELYQTLIDQMRGAGVQPSAKTQPGQESSPPHADDQHSSAEQTMPWESRQPAPERVETASRSQHDPALPLDGPESSIFGLVTLVRKLLDTHRESLGLPVSEPVAGEQRTPMRPAILVDVLSRLQSQFADGAAFDLPAARKSNTQFKHALHDRLSLLATQQQQQVHALDQHIIDVVMMLFDFVLEDPAMPAPMKVIIARLQIPVLQVAIGDRIFLSDRNHPVRGLLNNLSRAAIRWVDDGDYSQSSTFGMIEQSVNRVVDSREQSATLYEQVNQQFSDFLLRQEEAAKVSEERLGQVSRGQEQLAAAREQVAIELDRLMHDQIPLAVFKILDEAWRDVLTLTLLRDGADSKAWNKMVRVAERLIDSVIPRIQEWERQKIMRDIPLLLADLREGFFSVSYDASKTAVLLKQLQLCHITVLRGTQPQMKRVDRDVEEQQLIADTELAEPGETLIAADMEIGQWLKWQRDDGKEMRAKLSWRSEIADLLLFVDNNGRKVIEMTHDDLNRLFCEAHASLIREVDEPIMDRAMRQVYNTLRQTVAEPTATPA